MSDVGRGVGLEIAAGNVGGGDGEETIDDDRHTELLAETGHLADDSLEVATGDDDGLALLELMLVIGDYYGVGVLLIADNLERSHLTLGDNEGLLLTFVAKTIITVVEAEMGEVGIVENVGLEDILSAFGKENVGKARLFEFLALAVDQAIDNDGGMVNLNALSGEVIVGRFDTPVGGTEDIPTRLLFCGLDIVGGHPCW